MREPKVNDRVLYVSHGTPDGTYPSTDRAATVTEVTPHPAGTPDGEGFRVGLCVLNPTGMFFPRDVPQSQDERTGGTWHWPDAEPTPGPAAPPAEVPSDVIDVSRWNLTSPNPGAAVAPITAELAGYADAYFYARDGATHFVVPAGGATTKGSSYPRSELRELNRDGSKASWSTTSGTHELQLTTAVLQAPPTKPQVVVAQIHDATQDVIEVMYDGTKDGGALVLRYLGPQRKTLRQPYALGTDVDLKIRVTGGKILVYVNGQLEDTISHKGVGCYFKVGNYLQTSSAKGDAATATSIVRLRRLLPPVHTA